MPSLDRAYGFKGAIIAIIMAAIAGAVHGVMAATFDVLVAKVAVGLAGSIVRIIAGVVSARKSFWGAAGVGLAMGTVFFVLRWGCWALMVGDLASFLATPPWGWPGYLDAAGISAFWRVEAVSMFVPAMIGCLAGQERAERPEEAC